MLDLLFVWGKNYRDELWRDIIPMDTYQILLVMPWLFHRKVMHDGHLNIYAFSKYGKRITLVP